MYKGLDVDFLQERAASHVSTKMNTAYFSQGIRARCLRQWSLGVALGPT
jgi:hypothetical protein